MKKKRHSLESIMRILRASETGTPISDLCREHEITEQTFYRWRRKYADMELSDARKFNELKEENRRLKALVADQALNIEVLKELSEENVTYGYRFITALLRREGWRVNRKKVQRLRRAEGLQGHVAKKKKGRKGVSSTGKTVAAEMPNDVWSWDFIFDTTEEGRSIKILSVVDEATRFCVDLNVNRKIGAKQVRAAMDQACLRYGQPKCIRSDNGPEFIASAIREWIEKRQMDCVFIEPGSPWQNPFVESFHSRFRNDCLNREWFINELDARVTIADWRERYNDRRPHSGIDYKSPAELYLGKASGSGPATPSLHRRPCQNQPEPITTIK